MRNKFLTKMVLVLSTLACVFGLVACAQKGDDSHKFSDTHEHSYANYEYNNDANCGTDGTETGKCMYCDKTDTRKSEIHLATGNHTYNTDNICTVCGHDGSIGDNECSHIFGDYISNFDATCTEDGTKSALCVKCGYRTTIKDENTATGHRYSQSWSYNEFTHYHSAICVHNDLVVDSAEHVLGEWVIIKEPTKLENGLRQKKCIICEYSQKETINKVTYDYTNGLEYKLNDDGTGYIVTGSGESSSYCVKKSDATCIGVHYAYKGLPVVGISSLSTSYGGVDDITADIRTINLPDTVSSVSGMGKLVNLKSINVSDTNPYFSTVDGILFSKDKTELVRYPSGKQPYSYSIPNSVKIIGGNAFSNITSLRSVVFPNGLEIIGAGAFSGCANISNISLPNSLKHISSSAFPIRSTEYNDNGDVFALYTIYKSGMYLGNSSNPYMCFMSFRWVNMPISEIHPSTKIIASCGFSNLLSGAMGPEILNIPDSVQYIGDNACDLTSTKIINIGKGVKEIGESAFGNSSMYNKFDAINVSSDNPYFCSENGILYNKGKTRLLYYPYGKTDLTEYNIPDTVESIDSYAIRASAGFNSITIPKGVTYIGKYALSCSANKIYWNAEIPQDIDCQQVFNSYNQNISSIILGDNVKIIPKNLFRSKTYLTDIKLGNDLTEIPNYAFYNCRRVSSIEIPNSVASIGDRAFFSCSALTSITIPNSVISVGERAFSGCNAVTSLAIGSGLKSLGGNAFDCNNLASISVDSNNANFVSINGILYNKAQTDIIYVPKGKSGNVELPNSVTSISSGIFSSSNVLKDIENGVTYIDKWAISSSKSNTSVVLRAGTVGMADGLFANCNSLSSITIPNSITNIGEDAFYSCGNLESVIVEQGNKKYHSAGNCIIETASKTLIVGCKNSVIPTDGSVTSIGKNAFAGCGGLSSITIPNSITNIGEDAFYSCGNLESVIVEQGNKKYHSAGNCIIETASKTLIVGCKNSVIPTDGSVTSIGKNAFAGCGGLSSITIPNSITNIGSGAFGSCDGLISLSIGNSVISIGAYAFKDCKNLSVVLIPNSVTRIDDFVFSGCDSLMSITIPSSVAHIGKEVFPNRNGYVLYCEQLDKPIGWDINWITSRPSIVWDSKNNDKDEFGYANIVANGMRFIIKNGVASVAMQAKNVSSEIVIPSSVIYDGTSYQVTSLENNAFSGCSSLTSVVIPSSITKIGQGAFSGCSNLMDLTMGNSVMSIGDMAFYSCSSLASVTIPASVKSIGYGAFMNCNNLTSATFERTSGWTVGITSVSISSSDLSNRATAAKYLTTTYSDYTGGWSHK